MSISSDHWPHRFVIFVEDLCNTLTMMIDSVSQPHTGVRSYSEKSKYDLNNHTRFYKVISLIGHLKRIKILRTRQYVLMKGSIDVNKLSRWNDNSS